MKKLCKKIYINLILIEISLRNLFLGFENVNNRLQTVEMDIIIPILKKFGATIGMNCEIESPIIINVKGDYSNLSLGNNVYIGKNCFLDLKGKIRIEDHVTISMQNTLISHIDLGKDHKLGIIYPKQHGECVIKKHVYLGANCTVLGVSLHEGAFVAAGSVVNKDVEAYTLVAGNPAGKIKNFNQSTLP